MYQRNVPKKNVKSSNIDIPKVLLKIPTSLFQILQKNKNEYICLSQRSLAVGARNGYRLFSLNAVDQIEQIYENGKL